MLWYVAIIAVGNLGLGYALATYVVRDPVTVDAGEDSLDSDVE